MTREPDVRPTEPPGSLFTFKPSDQCTNFHEWAKANPAGRVQLVPPARLRAAEAAAAHADRTSAPDWQQRAAVHLLRYGAAHEPFLVEDAVAAWEAAGEPAAPDSRAWGSVAAKLARGKAIYPVGARKDRFGSLKNLWAVAKS